MKFSSWVLGVVAGSLSGSLLAFPAAAQTAPVNVGSVNVTASATSTVTMTIANAATLGKIAVLTQGASGLDFSNAGGGSCTTGKSYAASSTCTVAVGFKPKVSGVRYGAVQLIDANGNLMATSNLAGTGTGPQTIFLPGAQSVISTSALNAPGAIAVDASDNLYIADTTNNRVLKETLASGTYTEAEIGSGLSSPSGIALDGSGNVYIADSGNNRILLETNSAGAYTQSVIVNSGLYRPAGVAVDASGNVYIADTYNNRLLKETLTAGAYTQTMLNSDLYEPNGVTVDAAGNIYIADTGNWRVLKLTLQSNGYFTQMPMGSGLYKPQGVAVDGNGNVYIADDSRQILQETPSGNFYAQNVVANSESNGLAFVNGVAVDGSGNVFLTDTANNRILKEDLADAPTLGFSASQSTEAGELALTVVNVGNAPLTFPVPSTGTNPSVAANFTLDQTVKSACTQVSASASAAASLAAGQFCVLAVGFDPPAGAKITGTLVLTNNNMNAAAAKPAVQSVTLSAQGAVSAQTINFPLIASQYAATQVPLVATATSGLPVSFGSQTTSVCTVSQSSAGAWTVSLLTSGNCSLVAGQAGNNAYSAAPTNGQTFWVYHAAQTIAFGAIPSQVINTPLTLTAKASSGLAVSYTSTTTTICSVSGATATPLAVGTCTIQANQAGNAAYGAAATVTQSFSVATAASNSGVNSKAQTITFPAIAAHNAATTVALTATANSGLAVSYKSATPAICTVSGSTASLLAYGTCTVTASQAGNQSYAAAKAVSQNISVLHIVQTVTFATIAPQTLGVTLTLTATASSGLAVKYVSTSPTICTVSGSTATLLAYGTCNLTAGQPGNTVYSAAAAVKQSFAVHHVAQTITFASIATQKVGVPLTLTATASSGLAVSYASTTPTICTVSGNKASLLVAGRCTLVAEQAGNVTYGAATNVTQSFTVTK
jgi:sugar lactone lactonase YvrE